MKCSKCGMDVEKNEVNCRHCGHNLKEVHVTNKRISNTNYGNANLKSKDTAILFALLLGCFGAHNFYLGFTKNAISQLILTLFGFYIIVFFWVIFDIYKIVSGKINKDSNGLPLKSSKCL